MSRVTSHREKHVTDRKLRPQCRRALSYQGERCRVAMGKLESKYSTQQARSDRPNKARMAVRVINLDIFAYFETCSLSHCLTEAHLSAAHMTNSPYTDAKPITKERSHLCHVCSLSSVGNRSKEETDSCDGCVLTSKHREYEAHGGVPASLPCLRHQKGTFLSRLCLTA